MRELPYDRDMRKSACLLFLLVLAFVSLEDGAAAIPLLGFPAHQLTGQTHTKDSLVQEDYACGTRMRFNSALTGGEKAVFISLPASYEKGSFRYPVCYVLDGRSYYEPFAGVVKYLSLYEIIPEMIVVAVESGDRLNEFTYTKADEKTGDWPTSGGADAFRKFLSDELIPTIDASYRTQPFKILIGHSLAGLFAVETLSRHYDLFEAVIALDPSLYWNQFEWLKNAEGFLGRIHKQRRFLLISGETKEKEETDYLNTFNQLASERAPASFFYDYRRFPEETHTSIGLPALFYSLKRLFQGWGFSGEAWEAGPEKVEDHFRSLSERYGFSIPVREEFLNGHAYHGLRRHKAPDEAIRLFEFCLSLYPSSDDACAGIGEAYEMKGIVEKAVESYRRALELNPRHEHAKSRLEKLK